LGPHDFTGLEKARGKDSSGLIQPTNRMPVRQGTSMISPGSSSFVGNALEKEIKEKATKFGCGLRKLFVIRRERPGKEEKREEIRHCGGGGRGPFGSLDHTWCRPYKISTGSSRRGLLSKVVEPQTREKFCRRGSWLRESVQQGQVAVPEKRCGPLNLY